MDSLENDRKSGKINDEEYQRRKKDIEKGSIIY
jgi:hypothetical protein